MSTSDDCQVPVRDGHAALPEQTLPEEMYWLRHMNREELSEKFVSLRDDFYTLKKFSCRQEDKIKKLQTKLRKLIADKRKDGKGSSSFSVKELEYQEALDTQQQTIRELRLKTEHLEKKLKLANIQLHSAKKNKPMLFRHVGARVDSGLKQPRGPLSSRPASTPPSPKSSPSNRSSGHASASSLQQQSEQQLMPERVREILEEARERIVGLEGEREDLQEQLTEKQQAAENAEYEAQQRIALLEEEVVSLKEELHHQGVREERNSVAVVRAERETHTLSARTVALQEQLVATEEKVAAEKLRKDALHSELERITEKLLATENQLRGLHEEQLKTAGKLVEVTEKNKVYEVENRQLKDENERLTTLNLNFEQQGLATENEALKTQISQLESALQTDLSERSSFLEHMTQDKENLARAEEELKELRKRLISLDDELQKANSKLHVYSKAGLLNIAEKDLTLLQQREAHSCTKECEKLREAHSELQLLYRKKSKELEQLAVTLASHSKTYQSLEAQVVKVTKGAEEKESKLKMTIKSLQDTIRRREESCEKLETQILTLTDKNIKDKLKDLGPHLSQTVGLGKHDNVLEFHIERVMFELQEFCHLKTFVSWTVPFSLEDPLQHTNVAIGLEAHYNYSALYKFQVNHRNLNSLREDTVTVSVYILLDSGHPAKIGECGLTFKEVLDHPRNTLHGTVPVLLAHDDAEEAQHLTFTSQTTPGQVIGNMSYWFRLQRPSEEAIAQHLRVSGVLTAAQRKNSMPKESNIMKAGNSVRMKRVTNDSIKKNVHEEVPALDVTREGNISEGEEETPPVPAPRTHLHPSLSPEKKILLEKSESSLEPHPDSLEHSQNECVSKSESESLTEGSIDADLKTLQETRSRSQSISSTGTYNIESPKKSKISPSSKISTKITGNQKNIKTKKYSDHYPVSHSSASSSKSEVLLSSSSKKLSPSKSPAGHAEDVSLADGPVAGPSTNNLPEFTQERDAPQPHPRSDKNTKSTSHLAVSSQDSNSSNQEFEDQLSSSDSSVTDSEGVVAVVPKTGKNEQSRIYIEVTSLTLWPDCGVLQDPKVELIFVDYHGFLGLPPDQLESPLSLSKHAPDHTLNFNFGQEFSVCKKQHPMRVQTLTEFLSGRGILKFTITSEPPEELQDTQDCQDLGYAYVDLNQLARDGQDLLEGMLVVESAEDGSQIGVLKVTLLIVQALEYLGLV